MATQGTRPAENQKSGAVEEILHSMIGHADTFKDFMIQVQSLTPAEFQITELTQIAAAGLRNIPIKLETEVEDLTTIVEQVGRLRALAAQKGYTDILEVLDQKLPYDRHY